MYSGLMKAIESDRQENRQWFESYNGSNLLYCRMIFKNLISHNKLKIHDK